MILFRRNVARPRAGRGADAQPSARRSGGPTRPSSWIRRAGVSSGSRRRTGSAYPAASAFIRASDDPDEQARLRHFCRRASSPMICARSASRSTACRCSTCPRRAAIPSSADRAYATRPAGRGASGPRGGGRAAGGRRPSGHQASARSRPRRWPTAISSCRASRRRSRNWRRAISRRSAPMPTCRSR